MILAALLAWITLFFAARSVRETAVKIFSAVLPFFASLTADSSLLTMSLLTSSLFLELLRALLAVVVTGICLFEKTKPPYFTVVSIYLIAYN